MAKLIIVGGGIAGLSAGIFALENGFKEANFTIKEKNIIYEMLYYNKNDKKVSSQEYHELIQNYFGKLLYHYFYKNK